MKSLLIKFGFKKPPTNPRSISVFLREAPSREQKRVFLDAARKASEDQLKILQN